MADTGSQSITRCMTKRDAADWRRGIDAAYQRLVREADGQRTRRQAQGEGLTGPVRDPDRVTHWVERRTGNGCTEWSRIEGSPMIPRR